VEFWGELFTFCSINCRRTVILIPGIKEGLIPGINMNEYVVGMAVVRTVEIAGGLAHYQGAHWTVQRRFHHREDVEREDQALVPLLIWNHAL
jgi:hypothetical protein